MHFMLFEIFYLFITGIYQTKQNNALTILQLKNL
jgi:hypothetical protein